MATNPEPLVAAAQRSVIARQLHDGIGQPMTSLLMEVQRAREEGELPPEVLERIENLARTALRSARQVVLTLSDGDAAHGPLEAARAYAESTLAIAGCELVWDAVPGLHDLPWETARELAGVIRESVDGIARHVAAQTIYVRVTREGASVGATVEGDGV